MKEEKGKRKRRGSRMGPMPLTGTWRWGEVPTCWETPTPMGRSAATEGELQGLRGEPRNWSVAVRTEWDLHRWSMPQQWAPSLKLVSTGAHGSGCWNVEFGEQTQGGDSCWLWGDSLRGQEWGAPQPGMLRGQAQTPPQKQSTIVEWHAKGWAAISASLLTHQLLPPQELGRTPTRAS